MSLLENALNAGFGCFYCGQKDGNDMFFSWEFDSPVHRHCAVEALKQEPDNLEAKAIVDEANEIFG